MVNLGTDKHFTIYVAPLGRIRFATSYLYIFRFRNIHLAEKHIDK